MKRLRIGSATVLAALVLAGCGSTVKLDDTPVESRTPVAVNAAAAGGSIGTAPGAAPAAGQTAGAAQSQVATVSLPAAGAAVASPVAAGLGRLVFFDFDSFIIDDKYNSLIEGHAKVLAANRGKRVVIEGHTDERGGREYNLALGQKRAAAVARALALLGANEAQVEAVSFGKERPVSEGHDEAAWAQNRRAEIKDR